MDNLALLDKMEKIDHASGQPPGSGKCQTPGEEPPSLNLHHFLKLAWFRATPSCIPIAPHAKVGRERVVVLEKMVKVEQMNSMEEMVWK